MKTPKTKTCADCGARKPIDEFGKSPHTKDKHAKTCRACHSAKIKAAMARKKAAAEKSAPVEVVSDRRLDSIADLAEPAVAEIDRTRTNMLRRLDALVAEFRGRLPIGVYEITINVVGNYYDVTTSDRRVLGDD